MDADTLAMLGPTLRHLLTDPSERSLTARLDDLGWDEVVAEDAPLALTTLFEIKGETRSSVDALGPRLAQEVARVLGNESLVTASVVLPPSLDPDDPVAVRGGDEWQGVVLSPPAAGSLLVVPCADAAGAPAIGLVRASSTGPTLTGIEGMDPDLGLTRLALGVAPDDVTWHTGPDAASAWAAAVAAGRWALAAELVGLARHVVAGAVAYAGERKQYGRAIGSFQAVQHRLASAHASVVGATLVVAEAARSGSPWEARVAKALAGRAAEEACTQAQQVYGAIGFTWEHELHRYLRRTYALDRLLGDWRKLEFAIGAELQRTRHVPIIGTL